MRHVRIFARSADAYLNNITFWASHVHKHELHVLKRLRFVRNLRRLVRITYVCCITHRELYYNVRCARAPLYCKHRARGDVGFIFHL